MTIEIDDIEKYKEIYDSPKHNKIISMGEQVFFGDYIDNLNDDEIPVKDTEKGVT